MNNLIETITQAVRGAFGITADHTVGSGFKAIGDHWVAWWSNSFKDRDGEWFPESAIDEYVRRVDVGVVPYPELWFWHTPGTRFGQAEWVGRIEHLAVAVGTFDQTPLGSAMKEAFTKGRGRDYGMSHGFRYDPAEKRDGCYWQFNTFELSILPLDVAANPFTTFEEVKAMTLTPEKTEALKRLIGEDQTNRVIEESKQTSQDIEKTGVAYKDFVRMTEKAAPEDEPAAGEPAGAAPEDDTEKLAKEGIGDLIETVIGDLGMLNEITSGLLEKLRAVEQSGTDTQSEMETKMSSLRKEADENRKAIAELRARLDEAPRSAARGESPEAKPELVKEATKSEANESLRKVVPGLFAS